MRFARLFATSFAVLLLLQFTFVRVHAATVVHGCAPSVPPLLPGTPGLPPTTPGIVLINEVLNNPGSTWNCAEAPKTFSLMTDSWVELYNPQNQPFDLYAAHTSLDSGPNTFTFQFPFGAAIAARAYMVVFPDSYSGMLKAGNNLRLTIAGTEIDQVSIPALTADTSYARIPDGSTNWQIVTKPTINASNMSSTGATPTPLSTQGSGNQSNGYSGNSNTTPTIANGNQPGWTKLRLPATIAPETPVANTPLLNLQSSPAPTGAWDGPRRILLTVLVVALALVLFWCWKLFSG